MKRTLTLILGTVLASYGLAQDAYIVKRGDTFSQIVKRKFPSHKLYGPNGKINQVITQNLQIKNPNRIYPKQVINFIDAVSSSVVIPLAKAESRQSIPEEKKSELPSTNRRVSFLPGLEEWNISGLMGAKYLSVSQTGALGSISFGALFLNDFKLNSEFIFENWSAWLQFDSYKFKYKSLRTGDSQQMYTLDFGIAHKWMMAGIGFEQNPLIRNNAGTIEMTRQSSMYLSLGAKKDIELPTRRPTAVRLKCWLHYPLSSATDNAQVKLSSVSGFGASGQVAIEREIFSKEIYSLHATWITDVGYQQLSQVVEWDNSEGKLDSTIINASSALGLLFKF
ncbi:MAG TPA: hypothetical protein VNJ01_11030 [Bacteriovoracaceae bacterium]|nr:hypothetical protein [Bacteriovoracaceae bacterium]